MVLLPWLAWLIRIGAVVVALLLIVAWLFAGRLLRRMNPDPPCPPDTFDLPFEHVTLTARDGMELGGWLTGERGRRPTVIFCAGLFGSMDGDTQMLPMFFEAGLDVLQFDWRGHGISDGGRVTLGVGELNDLLGAIDWLQARGVTHIGLLGFSMGGAVALRAAARDKRVACVVSDGGFVVLAHALQGALKERINLRLRPLVWLVLRMIEIRLGFKRIGQTSPLRVIGQISPRPVLLIHGGADPFVPVRDQDRLYAACGEPKEMWRVEKAGHREVHEVEPEEYRERVVGFFVQHLKGR